MAFMVGAAALPEGLPVPLWPASEPDPEAPAPVVLAPEPLAPDPLAPPEAVGVPRTTVVELAAETVKTVVELVPGIP